MTGCAGRALGQIARVGGKCNWATVKRPEPAPSQVSSPVRRNRSMTGTDKLPGAAARSAAARMHSLTALNSSCVTPLNFLAVFRKSQLRFGGRSQFAFQLLDRWQASLQLLG
jgi:hypothetical protein